MALYVEDECVGCPDGMGCIGDSCQYKNVHHYTCDECGEEFDPNELAEYDDEMLCKDCLFEKFEKVRK